MARSMSEIELKMWRGRMDFSDRVWKKFGLTESREQLPPTGRPVASMKRWRDYYRGQIPLRGYKGIDDEDEFRSNILFGSLNVLKARLSGRDPQVVIAAKGNTLAEPDARRRARLNEVLMQSQIREGKYKRQMDRALLSALQEPFGFVRHGYTPNIDWYSDDESGEVFARFKNHRPDFPWIQFTPNWGMRIDPHASYFDPDAEPRWCAFYVRLTEAEKRKSSYWIDRRDWKPTVTSVIDDDQGYETRHNREASEEDNDLYEAWIYYDAEDRKTFALSPGFQGDTVTEVRDWEIEYGRLPYTMISFNEQTDTPFGIPFPEMIKDEVTTFNQTWTIIRAQLNRMHRKIIINGNAFDEDQKQLLSDPISLLEVIESKGDVREALAEIGISNIDPSLFILLGQLKGSIFETIGVSNFDRAQRANVESAQEAGAISAGSETQQSRTQSPFEEAWADVLEVSHQTALRTEDPRKFFIPIVGTEAADVITQDEVDKGFAAVEITQLQGEFDYAIRLGSTMPLDQNLEFQRDNALYQGLGGLENPSLNHLEVAKDMVDHANRSEKWVQEPKAVQQTAKVAQREGQEPAGANGSQPNVDFGPAVGRA